jgi:hypothetical protein
MAISRYLMLISGLPPRFEGQKRAFFVKNSLPRSRRLHWEGGAYPSPVCESMIAERVTTRAAIILIKIIKEIR